MQLRSGQTPWTPSEPKPLTAEPLAGDTACDVAIIGGGVSGALAAYYLTKDAARPLRVVMLDKRTPTSGSISASTALLQYEMDTTLTDLAAKIGRQNATRAYQISLDALRQFDEIVSQCHLDTRESCGYRRRASLFLAGEDATAADLNAEWRARRAAGIDVDYLDRATLKQTYGIDRPAALLSADAAEVDPVCFTRNLLHYSVNRGLTIHGQTSIVKYEPTAAGVTLTTDAGHTVSARHVIFCTGYETETFLKQKFVTLNTTFAVVSEPVEDFSSWPGRCLVWEAQTPYFYCRTTADNRIIIGGEDVETTDAAMRDALLPAKTATLVARFGELFPQIPFAVSRSWAGVFAESHDGMPYIGRHPAFPNGYFSLGYGGNGITFAQIAAKLIAADIHGAPSPDAGLFAFDRIQTARPLQTSG